MSFLVLQALEKTFPDGTRAVKGINLSIKQGEFIVLLGPSGCGKTTTLRMIAGLERPSGGRVLLDAQDVTHLRPAQRDVGFVFQFYALYPHLSVRENILFPLKAVGIGAAEQEEILGHVSGRLGLTGLLSRYPRQLSGGDRQRVALARAMVRRPRVYLMDEPLGTLDADLRLEMREFIRGQQLEMNVTTIYVTHDQEEAMSLADRIVVMDRGEICQVGPPTQVYDQPQSLFVANFVGSPGMNFIPGEVVIEHGATLFRADQGKVTLNVAGDGGEGRKVLGIRPEYIHLDPAGEVHGRVIMSEYLGAHWLIHLESDLGRLIARAGADAAYRPGDEIRLTLGADHCRIFSSPQGDKGS